MQKPDSLRAAIGTVLPDLARDADRLRLWVDKGRVRSHQTGNRAFAMEYTLSVLITDFSGHPALVFLAVNDWLAANQPELLTPDGGYPFEVDMIDTKTVDLAIELPLTERVLLEPRVGGGWNLSLPGEPLPLFPDDAALSEPPALLRQIWMLDELIVE